MLHSHVTNMNRTASIRNSILAVVICVILTASLVFGWVRLYHSKSSEISKIAEKLYKIDELENKYFDGDIDYKALDDAILGGYVEGIKDNRFGFYKGPEDTVDVKDSFKGNTRGIGISITEHPDHKTIYVIRVNESSPAEKAGLKPEDEITGVDGKSVVTIGYDKAYESLKREIGQKVQLQVLRGGKTLNLTVIYGDFVEQSVYYHMIDGVGYILINGFNDATVGQFKTALSALQKQGAKGLIFDLRHNGGGTVDSASKMLDILVPKGDIISAKYADGSMKVLHTSDENEIKLPMAVLTDEGTASASELFSADIRDFKKGKLFGTKTYGKGVMQQTYYLSDNSSVRITVAKFYPKGGVNFHGVGLYPDTEVKLNETQQKYFYLLKDMDDPVKAAAVTYLKSVAK